MFKEFYGLNAKPFHITPDLDFLYLNKNHHKAIACMEFGIMEDTSIILLTGDIGTGKTTLIRHMLTKFEKYVKIATIYNTNVDTEQLLSMILQEFSLPAQIETKAQALKTLQTGLEEIRKKGIKPVIIIDDAQNLSAQALEEIRQLSNLQSHDSMLVQIILVGQPELKTKLENPILASLIQRIGISYHIMPLTLEETEAYILHRLKVAGAYSEIFDSGALKMIFQFTQGNSRAINLICDHALVYGFADELKVINSEVIGQVIDDNPNLGKTAGLKSDIDPSQPVSDSSSKNPAVSEPNVINSNQEPGNWQQRVESRLQTLEQLMAEYNRELREVIKSMFEKERQKNDNLMLKYARLQSESKALRQELDRKK
jgi:general secretion pathway protein A